MGDSGNRYEERTDPGDGGKDKNTSIGPGTTWPMIANKQARPTLRGTTRSTTTRQSRRPEPGTPISAATVVRTQHRQYYTLLLRMQGIPNSMAPTRNPQDRLTRAERTVFNDIVYLWCIGLQSKTRKGMYCLVSHGDQAKRLKLSLATVRRAFRKLEHLELIKTTRRWQKTTHMELSLLITPGTLIYKRIFSFPQAKKNCGKVTHRQQKTHL